MSKASDLPVSGNNTRLDFIIFGATGFTGKHAVFHLAAKMEEYKVTWGVAGRNSNKLVALLKEATEKTGVDLTQTQILLADVDNEESLKTMCQSAKVLINCCGPYRLYGEAVVKAAIAGGANYVDVSGEPQFIETMVLKYDEAARAAGVYIISACGFDSIPNDVGVMYLKKNFDGVLNTVESYISGEISPQYKTEAMRSGAIHYGTWESLVRGLHAFDELGPLRKKMYPTPMEEFKPKIKKRGLHQHSKQWCVPFLGADASIVYRTQRTLYETTKERPVQFKPYIQIGGYLNLIAAIVFGSIVYLLSRSKYTMKLLLNYPCLFSCGLVTRDGPSEAVMKNTYYQVELFGQGWDKGQDLGTEPTKKMTVKVSGMNPGYGGTVDGLVNSAVTILRQKDKMPPGGGVLTTGVAFRDTDLVERLRDSDMKFEIVSGADTDKTK